MEDRILFRIDNELSRANVSRNIRFTEKLFEQLGQIAQEHSISFNLLVLQCCRYALEHIDLEESKKADGSIG